ncbi:DUF4097 family beta strand repeat-containing protein [Hymenobacter glacieicola]|uniref:DUF4097 domain-containing protein n=1 Tax=Hymenobacter glacieicola TaxID=1562124 RepID=A0ABQ1WJG5_9BACT|nr:DUF4097 family beta strand repeat-containing protein [Hymenobacter glacieicola]GGG32462.1 hypothetical protein GCM10011378_06120 [Hymenobacter glacieicola]
MNHLFTCLLAGAVALPAAAQKAPGKPRAKPEPGPAFTLTCTGRTSASALQKLYCETRDLTLPAPPAGTPLVVDARLNGAITVRGWAGTTVRVRARVEGRAASEATAKALAASVRISSQNNTLRAARPYEALEGWEVSYEVLVPRQTDLTLRSGNGHLTVENVRGALRCESTAGNLNLSGVGGDVRGKTTAGSVNLTLTGTAWEGPGLDVNTVNGSITWQLPAVYAATIMARTVQGRVQAELNTKRKSVLPHNLVATLGKGGAQLRAATVTGNVTVKQTPGTLEPLPAPEEGK